MAPTIRNIHTMLARLVEQGLAWLILGQVTSLYEHIKKRIHYFYFRGENQKKKKNSNLLQKSKENKT